MGSFGGSLDPFIPAPEAPPCDPFIDPTCIETTPIPPVIVIPGNVGGDLATAEDVGALASDLAGAVTDIKTALTSILRAIAGVLSTLALLWHTIVQGILSAIKKLAAIIKTIEDKVLKPILDAQRRMRQAILDIYNRFVRPWIVFIQRIRRIIAILHLFHIHVLDGLDRQLAKIEGKLLAPIYRLLYRTNTLGNWISFILTADLLIHRGLLLGSAKKNSGGVFNLVTAAPAYGFTLLPPAAPAAIASTPGQALADAHTYVETRSGPINDLIAIANSARLSTAAEV